MNISIKNAPEHLVERLRARADRNHRSLQGELMAILEAAVEVDDVSGHAFPAGRDRAAAPPGMREDSVSRWRGFFGPGLSTDEIMALTRSDD